MPTRSTRELRYLILALQREGNRLFVAELRPLGLTPSQAEVLTVLAEYGPLSLGGLGELLLCETGTNPSRLVERLVREGLVRRETDGSDRRARRLSLTEGGRAMAARVAAVETELEGRLDGLLADRDLTGTLDLLRSVVEAFPSGDAVRRRASR